MELPPTHHSWPRTSAQGILPNIWPENYWPPSSPDLNPLDFAVWGFLERETNSTPHPNVDSLKASIAAAWFNMSTDFTRKSCATFRHHVDAVIEDKGGYIE
ncbi:Uncharacterized protein FKW44_020353 [Caligus rogercresseyi]|uniref:Uncharacterized protein n=1 Tax=Caligus rogercresseyi TaxID=217165 RepID=A0A7T8GX58_CALRO|nr:Uncharacterized protein FKW44_020353 [Caligus rogercresseyi]